MPEALANYIAAFPQTDALFHRARRFRKYWECSDEKAAAVWKAWANIEKAAKSEDDLLNLFLVMPDQPALYPFEAIYGERHKYPDAEADYYKTCLSSVQTIESLLNPHRPQYLQLLQDATATPEAREACFRFRELDSQLLQGLGALRHLLEVIDPAAKIPTKHWKSPNAALHNYILLVASLNRYLRPDTPKHSALAVLANVNCPSEPITADQIRKAWIRGADKRT